VYETVIYEGGVYKADEMRELVEDLGGFILQEHKMQLEVRSNASLSPAPRSPSSA